VAAPESGTPGTQQPGLAMTTLDGILISVNDVLLKMWGYPGPGELLGRPIDVLWECAGETPALWRVLESQGGCTHDLDARRCDGTPFCVRFAANVVLGAEGRPTRVLATFLDVTEQKQEEAALRRQAHDLEAYAQMVAHDLSNPLARVIGYAEFLEAEPDAFSPAELAHYLRLVAEAGRQASNTLKELLLLARVRRAEGLLVKPLDMGAIVGQVLERMDLLIEEYRPEIELPECWPEVVGHRPWVEQVWENYLSNAFRYGGPRPRVVLGWDSEPSVASPAAQSSLHRFWVRDSGPGIPREKWGQLFVPFSRLSPRASGGHGLGLSIARQIVEKLGGEVGVESQLGAGSTFWFTLPKRGGCSVDT
jgi:PAS domain S-box-containing protein